VISTALKKTSIPIFNSIKMVQNDGTLRFALSTTKFHTFFGLPQTISLLDPFSLSTFFKKKLIRFFFHFLGWNNKLENNQVRPLLGSML
jgi:hypothetical protein